MSIIVSGTRPGPDGERSVEIGTVERNVDAEITVQGDRYRHYGVRVHINPKEKIYDLHIKFQNGPHRLVDDPLNPKETKENKVKLSSDFPPGWTSDYHKDVDGISGTIDLEAPTVPPGDEYDPVHSLNGGDKGDNFDFSFAFRPFDQPLGKVTITFTNTQKKVIASSDGKEELK